MHEDDYRTRKRAANACLRCRKHKIKCSGSQPCRRCELRQLDCIFGAEDKKVVVSEKLLQDLRNQVNELQNQHQTENAVPGIQHAAPPVPDHDVFGIADGASPQQSSPLGYYADRPMDLRNHEQGPSGVVTPDHTGISNPLLSDQPDYLTISGRLRYLGHTSSWSFTQQVLRMAHQSPHTRHISRVLNYVEGEAYTIPQLQPIAIVPADVTGLPSLSLSQLYVQTVCFRTYPLFHLFDETDFRSSLVQFYKSPIDYAHQWPLWFVQYLVVMAMGKALAHPGPARRTENGEGPGSQLFARALKLLPSVLFLCTDPILSTEISCCMALYLQSVDHRAAASISIGQAVRMAQGHGLHTNIQGAVVGDSLVQRARRTWWTVYALDRKLSSSFGVPILTHDEDIGNPFPTAAMLPDDPEGGIALMLYIRICQLQGKAMSSIYGPQCELNKTFVRSTKDILEGIASISSELGSFTEACFGEVSRTAAHLNLAYHQCILLASRPVVFFALQRRLDGSTPRTNRKVLSSTMKGLIQVCIDSATQIVTILHQLATCDLLDTFLPFDLECAASAGCVLAMASNIHPQLCPSQGWFSTLSTVLDSMILQRNVLAQQRKAEIEDLVAMVSIDPLRPGETSNNVDEPELETEMPLPPQDLPSLTSLGDPFFDNWNLDEAISGDQIMELASALDVGSLGSWDGGNGEDLWS